MMSVVLEEEDGTVFSLLPRRFSHPNLNSKGYIVLQKHTLSLRDNRAQEMDEVYFSPIRNILASIERNEEEAGSSKSDGSPPVFVILIVSPSMLVPTLASGLLRLYRHLKKHTLLLLIYICTVEY
jgi:hypothetical protein